MKIISINIVDGIQFDSGNAIIPAESGLGCELDEDTLERYWVE